MSSCEAPTLFSPRFAVGMPAFAALLLTGCAVGVDGTDDLPPLGVTPGATTVVDAGLAAPAAPVFDAGPIVPPLPPSLSTPQESSVPLPPVREAGTASRPTGTGGRADAGATTGTGAGSTRGGTAAGGASGTTTGCNALRCTNECSLAGPLQCCTLLDTCGCTWAPGAYCL